MLKIISFNANGIRAAARKGFFAWIEQVNPDIICLQETKAQEYQLTDTVFHPQGYYRFFHDAKKKGYSGVAIYTKYKPINTTIGLGWDTADSEGRYIQTDYDNLSVASIYLPSGTSGDERQNLKYEFLDKYKKFLQQQIAANKPFIICGDFNIAHHNIDIKNWKQNQKSSGFLPEERNWLTNIINDLGLIDAFRYLYPEQVQYTWWSNRAKAWDNNVGWRIDYHMLSKQLKERVIRGSVYREQKFSDHAPVIMEYSLEIA